GIDHAQYRHHHRQHQQHLYEYQELVEDLGLLFDVAAAVLHQHLRAVGGEPLQLGAYRGGVGVVAHVNERLHRVGRPEAGRVRRAEQVSLAQRRDAGVDADHLVRPSLASRQVDPDLVTGGDSDQLRGPVVEDDLPAVQPVQGTRYGLQPGHVPPGGDVVDPDE